MAGSKTVDKTDATSQDVVTPTISTEMVMCNEVSAKCWGDKAPYPALEERLLCMGFELGQLQRDAERIVKEGSNKTFAYHSIDQVENEINRLQFKYRCRVTPSVTGTHDFEGGVAVTVHFTARCWQTDEAREWDWVDDGQDLSKAGAFAVKYGILRHFGVGDGSIDVSETDGKTELRGGASRTRAGAPTPRSAPAASNVDDSVKAELYAIAKALPETAGWGFKSDGSNVKIDAQLSSPAFTPEKIKASLLAAYKKAFGKDYEPTPVPEQTVAEPGMGPQIDEGYPG